MASSTGATSLEQRRWVVVGIALQNVLTPCLRVKIQSEMKPFYQHLVASCGLDKQTYPTHRKTIPPSTLKLNYESINNNAALHKNPRHYDYRVKDEISLAKLFMKPFMTHFNAFDTSFDASAALAVLCGAIPFTSVRPFAEDVRSEVRNEWAHCNFARWTDIQYNHCFDLLEALVKNLKLLPADELSIMNELQLWRKRGLDICLGEPLDNALLHFIRNDVQNLIDSLHRNEKEQDKNMKSVCSTLAMIKSEFERAIFSIEEKQSDLQSVCKDLEKRQDTITRQMEQKNEEHMNLLKSSEINWKMRQEQLELRCNSLEIEGSAMQRDLDILKEKLERSSLSDESREIVFDAPDQSKWFTGRENELSILEKCLQFEKSGVLNMAAICGLGGCGKTTLAAHFAWERKPEYEGGVFWISMEDDHTFENSLNDLALRLGLLADSFDLTLSKVLNYLSRTKKPWLLVLDDVDQLNLSNQMRKVCCGGWRRQAFGHILLTTRRKSGEVCDSFDVNLSNCVELFSFSEDESVRFLVSRSGLVDPTGQEELLKELIGELGGLPLALEQAGAHIKALQCPISKYLEEYKSQRLKLLSQHPAKPSSEYESKSRLAVHTTWLINFEYVKKSTNGEAASSFVNVCAFLEPHEIQDEIIDGKVLSSDDKVLESSCGPLIKDHILEVITKFSLFQRISSTSLGLHRLVQEVIRTRMTMEETASSMLRAVRILHSCFRRCPSPDQIVSNVTGNVTEQASASVTDPSLFYHWSKLTIHASQLQQHLRCFLDQGDIGKEVKTVVLTTETSRIIYENAMKLSVYGHQEKAKEAERFAFQILDFDTCVSKVFSNEELRKLFPHTLPLSHIFQKIIFYSSRPPVEIQKTSTLEIQKSADTEQFRLQGNEFFKEGLYEAAISSYTEGIEAIQGGNNPDPLLFNNRATAYLKQGKFEKCIKDSNEYISIVPNCWKGYTRKALALNGLGQRLSALCFAAIAYHLDGKCCRRYEPFKSAFRDLDGNWNICESSEALCRDVMYSNSSKSHPKVLLLPNGEYWVNNSPKRHNSNTDFQASISNTVVAALGNDAKVTIHFGRLSLEEDCFFRGINLLTEYTLVAPNGNVTFENCLFWRKGSAEPLVHVNGTARFLHCTLKGSGGCGLVVQGLNASALMLECHVAGNGTMGRYASGVRVFNKGSVAIHKCHIHGNTRGIWVDEERAGVLAKEATITDSEIYDNKYEGILVAGLPPQFIVSLPVEIRGNKIYHNSTFGVRVMLNHNDVILENNVIFENFY
ncbi:uncharacterized protein LOC111337338 [Stylophora pistillata]|uniref:uncharacterized protein LOC111337338 n=1 Tax=Stylophora pistillata TaxID=50429 RepID=UPI000C0463CE|nr:uncharacterized protein LOC111337338 [Stylophora pistillata]